MCPYEFGWIGRHFALQKGEWRWSLWMDWKWWVIRRRRTHGEWIGMRWVSGRGGRLLWLNAKWMSNNIPLDRLRTKMKTSWPFWHRNRLTAFFVLSLPNQLSKVNSNFPHTHVRWRRRLTQIDWIHLSVDVQNQVHFEWFTFTMQTTDWKFQNKSMKSIKNAMIRILPLSNFFPSGSMSLTSKMSSNRTPAIVVVFYDRQFGQEKQRCTRINCLPHTCCVRSAHRTMRAPRVVVMRRALAAVQTSLEILRLNIK